MPEFPGRLRTPRLPSAPSAPSPGEMYYDTGTSTLYWWDGTTWKSASGGSAAPEVYISTDPPAPRVQQVLWVDTDSIAPTPVGTPSSVPPLVTSLPALPGNGQEVYLRIDATTGSIVHARYDAVLAQWIVLNGPVLLGKASAVATTVNFVVPSLTGLGLRHLRVVGKIRSTRAGYANTGFRFQVNGHSGADYASSGYNAGTFATVAPTTWGYMGQMPAGTASTLAHFTFEIPFAFDTDGARRMFISQMAAWDGAAPIGANMGSIIGPYPTFAPINRVTFMDDVGSTLDPASEVEVYGSR